MNILQNKFAYYNENNPNAAAWLRELIADKLISPGYVDTRSIADVQPDDLDGFVRVHLFAGVGGWDYALKLASWPDDETVWTCSCPCQPFSQAGLQKGIADERHLWPDAARLIAARNPPAIFGEQVASKSGREWLAGVFADLEGMGYHKAGADLCAASIGAPHIRQRLYWMAISKGEGRSRVESERESKISERARVGSDQSVGRMGQPNGSRRLAGQSPAASERYGNSVESASCDGGAAHSDGKQIISADEIGFHSKFSGSGRLGNADNSAQERLGSLGLPLESKQEAGRSGHADALSDYEIVGCADGKSRRIERGSQPLVNGLPKGVVRGSDPSLPINPQATAEARIMRLHGYGNAIVPQLAAMFIRSAVEAVNGLEAHALWAI